MTASLRARLLAAGVVVGVFASGVVVGLTLAPRRGSSAAQVRVMRDAGTESDLSRLGLSAEQRRRIDALVAAARPRSEAELRALAGRLQALADSLDRDIRAELTPAQRATLDSLVRANRRRRGPTFVLKRPSDDSSAVRPETLFARPRP